MSTTHTQISAYAVRLHEADSWTPKGKPIDRGFALRFAAQTGFPTYVRGTKKNRRGDLCDFKVPEEVLENPVLREQLEAQVTGQPDPYARTHEDLD